MTCYELLKATCHMKSSVGSIQVQLPQTREVVCMGITQDLVAVGSQSHVTLLDPRMSQPTTKIVNSVDPGQVRVHINYAQRCCYVLVPLCCMVFAYLLYAGHTLGDSIFIACIA